MADFGTENIGRYGARVLKRISYSKPKLVVTEITQIQIKTAQCQKR